ncbi:flagellar basal body rod protein FlgC [Coprothermobacter platensis]|uniref:flagellar basal body rod protein FlgC n=1 Tax=Coprothermobacter platensis TaxID=108819 RepID=UPI00037A0D52|nr:flagellar basal body rod protein FlgC [Coprothermobacter platensis]
MAGFSLLRIPGSALTAERFRMDVISSNLANIETTQTPEGGPYHRKIVSFETTLMGEGEGVRVSGVTEDTGERLVYDPSNPNADAQTGMVRYPDIDMITEMTDLISAQRSFEMNSNAIAIARQIYTKTLEIGK